MKESVEMLDEDVGLVRVSFVVVRVSTIVSRHADVLSDTKRTYCQVFNQSVATVSGLLRQCQKKTNFVRQEFKFRGWENKFGP